MSLLDSELIDEIVSKISKDELMNHTSKISQWERLSGSEDENKAFEYINDFLESLGIETKILYADSFISIPITGKICFEGITLDASPASMSGITSENGLEGKAEYVDVKILKSNEKLDLNGIIVVTDGMPMPSLISALEQSGCIAAIFIQSADLISESTISPVWGSPSIENMHRISQLPVVSINANDGEILKERLLAQPKETIKLYTKLDTSWKKIPILIAEIKADINTEDFILFNGHVDSWYYGAMDNGTANATMLEVARVITLSKIKRKMKRNLRLAFWSGHSQGRYAGSAWYADEFWQDIYDNCVININIDSVGANNSLILSEAHIMAQTKPIATEYVEKFTNQKFEGVRIGRAGDQSFWGHGVPSLFMTLSEQPVDESASGGVSSIIGGSEKSGGLGWWWHTPEDTIDKIDPDKLVRDANIYVSCIARFCYDEILPLDLRLSINEIVEQLEYWQMESGDKFNIQNLIVISKELKYKINEIYDLLYSETNDKNTLIINTFIKELNRILVPINYVSGDKFHHDPALNQPPIPSLMILKGLKEEKDEDLMHEIIVEARRKRNQLYFDLKEATKLADSIIKDIC